LKPTARPDELPEIYRFRPSEDERKNGESCSKLRRTQRALGLLELF
jgi:hypothetical protein